MSLSKQELNKNMIEFINKLVSDFELKESRFWTAKDEKQFNDINQDYVDLWSENNL